MAEPGKLEFGGVLTETLGVTAAKAKVLVPLALIVYAAPAVSLELWAKTPGDLMEIAMRDLIASFGSMPFAWALSILVARQALSETQRLREPFIDSVRATPGLILPIFGLCLLSTLGIVLATLLLIIPGLILGLAWIVAVPVRVAENISITEALGRSVVLTRDNRFRILGLFLIYWVSLFVISFVVSSITAAVAAIAGAQPDTIATARGVAATLAQTVGFMIGLVGVAVLYVELRSLKSSGRSDVAEVFA
jgi:hypothetical protein